MGISVRGDRDAWGGARAATRNEDPGEGQGCSGGTRKMLREGHEPWGQKQLGQMRMLRRDEDTGEG